MRITAGICLALVLTLGNFASADPIIGDTYFIAPGAGTFEGFQLAGGPYSVSTINGGAEGIGTDFSGNGQVTSSDSLVQNSSSNFDFTVRIETTGNFLPAGTIGDSGSELTTLGLFVGGGIDPIDFNEPVFANTAVLEAFDTSGTSIGTIDVVNLANFSTGIGGGWDGALGINFNNLIPVGDVGAIELRINFDTVAVPEPSSAALIGGLALTLLARRRRA